MLRFKLVSSLEKIFCCREPQEWKNPVISALYGERISFQIAYHSDSEICQDENREFDFRIKSLLQSHMEYRMVGLVPSNFPAYAAVDDNYITTEPGLFPDVLLPIKARIGNVNKDEEYTEINLRVSPRQWRGIWVDIELDSEIDAGEYIIELEARNSNGKLWSEIVKIEVINAILPKQKLIHTEWFHGDCLANYYQVPVFSEKHWRIIDNQIKTMVKHGINTLLTPIFTPPLDTQIGGERTTIQLIGIEVTKNGYQFDFSLLEKWIEMATDNGIEYFEMAHLFTQWGAKCAPKIMAKKDGEIQKIFGWESEATGEEYQSFLHQLLPALIDFIERNNLKDKVIFHISDEPHSHDVDSYQAAKNSVIGLLDGYYVMDAISDFQIYQSGIIEHPVVAIDHIQPYIDHEVKDLWAYYCCSQKLKVANRFMAMPSARNRILGVQLYKFKIKGLLHWGYNFYNSQYSLEPIDPYFVTDAGEGFPSGDPFLVYPGLDGEVVESIRLMVLSQAIQDVRAFQYLENLTSRDFVMNLIEGELNQEISFDEYPKSPEYLLELREKINKEIQKRV